MQRSGILLLSYSMICVIAIRTSEDSSVPDKRSLADKEVVEVKNALNRQTNKQRQRSSWRLYTVASLLYDLCYLLDLPFLFLYQLPLTSDP